MVVTFFYVRKLKLNREKYNKLFIGGESLANQRKININIKAYLVVSLIATNTLFTCCISFFFFLYNNFFSVFSLQFISFSDLCTLKL